MTFRENEHKFSQISRTSILKYQTIDILIMNASTRSILKGPLDWSMWRIKQFLDEVKLSTIKYQCRGEKNIWRPRI